jgi:hypothetical protein
LILEAPSPPSSLCSAEGIGVLSMNLLYDYRSKLFGLSKRNQDERAI